jgi:hypothetical protein
MADTDFGYVDGAPGKVKALSLATPQPTERQRIRDEIKAASIFAENYRGSRSDAKKFRE